MIETPYPTYGERMEQMAQEHVEDKRRAKHFDALVDALGYTEQFLSALLATRGLKPSVDGAEVMAILTMARAAIDAAKEA